MKSHQLQKKTLAPGQLACVSTLFQVAITRVARLVQASYKREGDKQLQVANQDLVLLERACLLCGLSHSVLAAEGHALPSQPAWLACRSWWPGAMSREQDAG